MGNISTTRHIKMHYTISRIAHKELVLMKNKNSGHGSYRHLKNKSNIFFFLINPYTRIKHTYTHTHTHTLMQLQ
jgi:hypothetical protein